MTSTSPMQIELINDELKLRLPRAEFGFPGDIVIFDGHCRFCWRQVARLKRCDLGHRLQFLSLHDPEVAERFPDLSHERLMEEMVVVTHDGGRFGGIASIRYLSRHLPLLWPLAPPLHIPGTLGFWRWAYRWVARRRYQLAGKQDCDGACDVHLR